MQNGPQHSSKASKTATSFKNLENDTQKSLGYPFQASFLEPTWMLLGHLARLLRAVVGSQLRLAVALRVSKGMGPAFGNLHLVFVYQFLF